MVTIRSRLPQSSMLQLFSEVKADMFSHAGQDDDGTPYPRYYFSHITLRDKASLRSGSLALILRPGRTPYILLPSSLLSVTLLSCSCSIGLTDLVNTEAIARSVSPYLVQFHFKGHFHCPQNCPRYTSSNWWGERSSSWDRASEWRSSSIPNYSSRLLTGGNAPICIPQPSREPTGKYLFGYLLLTTTTNRSRMKKYFEQSTETQTPIFWNYWRIEKVPYSSFDETTCRGTHIRWRHLGMHN